MNEKPILYVEDDDNDAIFLTRAFQKAGVTNALFVVGDGQQAVDFLEGNSQFADRKEYPLPCLVLLDLNLPKKPGLAVLRWIREQPGFLTLPVVMLSASNYEFDVHRAYAFGANAYLVKPPEYTKVVGMVRSLADFWLTYNEAPLNSLKFKNVLTQEMETGALNELATVSHHERN